MNCTKYFFISLKIFIMQWRKNSWDEITRLGIAIIVASATPSYNICYLASKLCVCVLRLTQNQNELKKTQYGCVVRIDCFMKIWSVILCPNLMTKHAEWRYEALTQGSRTIKTFTKYKKYYRICHKTQERSGVRCWGSLWQNKSD